VPDNHPINSPIATWLGIIIGVLAFVAMLIPGLGSLQVVIIGGSAVTLSMILAAVATVLAAFGIPVWKPASKNNLPPPKE